MKSPIKYFGGKFYMLPKIEVHYPKDIYKRVYIEGFGGGAALLLSKDPYGVEIYNDLDKNVYSLFKVLSDKTLYGQFKDSLDLTPYSRDIREEYKKDLKKKDLTIIERAVKFFYVNRTSFNGQGSFCTNTSARRGMSKAVSDYLSAIDRLYELHQRISRVIIENMDILALLDKYNKEDTFFYLDPPYVHSTRKSTARYNCEMTDKQHQSMIERIISHKGKFLISGYDCDIYHVLEDNGFFKLSFKSPSSDMMETIWWNYHLENETRSIVALP